MTDPVTNTGQEIKFVAHAWRWPLKILGFLCVGLATLGMFLPVLPTVPLLLVAAWAFSKSSPEFHHWLWTHPKLGPGVRAWHHTRALTLRTKIAAPSAMAVCTGVIWFATGNPYLTAGVGGLLVCVSTYLVTRPRLFPDGSVRLRDGTIQPPRDLAHDPDPEVVYDPAAPS